PGTHPSGEGSSSPRSAARLTRRSDGPGYRRAESYLSNSSTMTFQSSSALGSGGGRTTRSRPSLGRAADGALGFAGAAEGTARGAGGLEIGAGVFAMDGPVVGETGRAAGTAGLLGAATAAPLVR